MGNVLTLLKMALSLLLISLSIPLGITFQRLMSINYHAEYTFEIPIGSQMSNLGAFCLVSTLLLLGGWGILTNILPKIGEGASTRKKELRLIVLSVLIILLIGMAIVGNYFAQRVDRWSF
jgi:membrane protease YdiL (CAAX protease family)